MRVVYQLNREDVRKILADKFEVNPTKVSFQGPYEITAEVDMSATETPETLREPEEEPETSEKDVINIPVPASEPTEDTFRFPEGVVVDNELTDDDIKAMIIHKVPVTELCRHYGFSNQAKYRLYKRFEKIRSELASCTQK